MPTRREAQPLLIFGWRPRLALRTQPDLTGLAVIGLIPMTMSVRPYLSIGGHLAEGVDAMFRGLVQARHPPGGALDQAYFPDLL